MEADLHARNNWLQCSDESIEFKKRIAEDPNYYDSRIAGWWVWGQSCWIGGEWCENTYKPRPRLTNQSGVHSGRPQLTDAFDIGRGVNANGRADTYDTRREWLTEWMRQLADRLRLVRTCYGHWSRICDSESTLTKLGLTGVFLDPPYPKKRKDTGKKSRDGNLYAGDKTQCLDMLRDEILAWCQKYGDDRQIRIAVCGYDGDGYDALIDSGWTEYKWESQGGYSNLSGGKNENTKRERIWFSPSCIDPIEANNLFIGISDE
jgi:hypothetical protein